jgi:hypothetical protein
MDAPFYLAVGDCVIEPGDGSSDYHVTSMSFPEPDPDGCGGHRPAKRELTLRVEGSTAAELSSNIAALRRQCVRDERLHFRPGLVGDILECRIREASVVEDNYDPLRRSGTANFNTYLTLSILTDPYWLGAWTDDVTPTVSEVPGHFDVTPTGEVDALVRLRAVFADQGTVAAIGVKPEPGASYDYVDDYGTSSDTSDANAVGGYKVGEVVDSSLAGNEIGTAPNIDTNDNRGRHLVLARMDSTATTASSNTARVQTITTGNAIADSVTVSESTVTFSSNALIGYEMGTIQIPAGQVPDLDTGSGYAAETLAYSQTTEDADTVGLTAYQTVGLAAGEKLTKAVFKTGTLTSAGGAYVEVYATDSGLATGGVLCSSAIKSVSASNTEYSFGLDWTAPSAATYALKVRPATGTTALTTRWRKNSTGGFAGGEELSDSNTAVTGDDLYFKLYTKLPLGFNTTNPIQAACSESSKTIALDYVQRIPVDFAALVYRITAAGTLGLFYDGDTDTPYVADADGIGPAIYDKCEIRKPLRLKPGVTNRVVLGVCQADESIGGATVTYSYRPRFLTATG